VNGKYLPILFLSNIFSPDLAKLCISYAEKINARLPQNMAEAACLQIIPAIQPFLQRPF
jgi:hypothetical protein